MKTDEITQHYCDLNVPFVWKIHKINCCGTNITFYIYRIFVVF